MTPSGRSKKNNDSFYDDLSAEIQSKDEYCILLGNFNGHVGSSIDGYGGVHGGTRWAIQNKDEGRLLEFADSFDVVVGDMFIKKDSEKLITFKSGGKSSVIN